MLLDKTLEFSLAQALTATGVSTNYLDLGSDRDIGQGEPLSIMIDATVSADITTGDETYQVQVQTDDNTSFSSPTTIGAFTLTAAQLAAGAPPVQLPFPLTNERYVRLNYVLGGTTPSVTLNAYLTLNEYQAKQAYPVGYAIL